MSPLDGGGLLGVFTNSTGMNPSAAAPIVAVEFDTFQNEWDQRSDHIGIDVNSINSTAVKLLPDRSLIQRHRADGCVGELQQQHKDAGRHAADGPPRWRQEVRAQQHG